MVPAPRPRPGTGRPRIGRGIVLLALLGLAGCGEPHEADARRVEADATVTPGQLLVRIDATDDPAQRFSLLSRWLVLASPYREHTKNLAVLVTRMHLAVELLEAQQLLRDFEIYDAIARGRIEGQEPPADMTPPATVATTLVRALILRLEAPGMAAHPHRVATIVARLEPVLAHLPPALRRRQAGRLRWLGSYRLRAFELDVPAGSEDAPRVLLFGRAADLRQLGLVGLCRRWQREHGERGLRILLFPYEADGSTPLADDPDWHAVATDMGATAVLPPLRPSAREGLGLGANELGCLVVDRKGRVLARQRSTQAGGRFVQRLGRQLDPVVQRAATR